MSCSQCKNVDSSKEKELELKERELGIRERELKAKENEIRNENNAEVLPKQQPVAPIPIAIEAPKYIYAVFKVQEPKLDHIESKYFVGSDRLSSSPEINMVSYDTYIYLSEIKEIANFDENKQYEYLDKFEAKVNEQLMFNTSFETAIYTRVSDRDEQEKLKKNTPKIIDRKIKVFNTYKEASISKNNNKDKF
jgi:hypothetical protein